MRAHARARSRAPAPTMVGTWLWGDGGRVEVQINPGSTLYLFIWSLGTGHPEAAETKKNPKGEPEKAKLTLWNLEILSRRNQSNSCC